MKHSIACALMVGLCASGAQDEVTYSRQRLFSGFDRKTCKIQPSLAKLGGKYYLTLRTDVQGLWAESDDGVTFSKPRPWRWDDGSLLENYNTQQHWLRPDGALYLAYTRRGAHNDHVFRHRAPIFMAKFDAVRGCLARAAELNLPVIGFDELDGLGR